MPYFIVGAGLWDAVLTERIATVKKLPDVIEQRDHICGNCFSSLDEETDIEKFPLTSSQRTLLPPLHSTAQKLPRYGSDTAQHKLHPGYTGPILLKQCTDRTAQYHSKVFFL